MSLSIVKRKGRPHLYLRGTVRGRAVFETTGTADRQAAEQIRTAQSHASQEIDRFRSSYATRLRFDYAFDTKASREPFLVTAIYHDDAFTYIRSVAREKPVFYELKDGKPNLVSFQLEDGVYIIPKIVDRGYLAVGKKKLNFARLTAAKQQGSS